MQNKKLNNGKEFLLTQFNILSNHIDTLISNGIIRIYSFLLIWALSLSALSILYEENLHELKEPIILICFFLLIIGLYLLDRQVHNSIRIVTYFRIINEIRKYFSDTDPELEKFLKSLRYNRLLPTSSKEPKSIKYIFDPGIFVLEILNAITISFVFWFVFCRILQSIFIFLIVLIAQRIYIKLFENKRL